MEESIEYLMGKVESLEERIEQLEKSSASCKKEISDEIKELPTWDDVRKAIEMTFKGCQKGSYHNPNLKKEIIEQLKQSKK